jgi:replicative DNA helicase
MDLVEKFAKQEAVKRAIAESVPLVKQEKFGEVEDKIKSALQVTRVVDNGLQYFSTLNDRWKRLHDKKEVDKFKLVFDKVNDSLEGGLNRKELAMVVAPPGVGKSLYLVNQGVTSLMEGRNVLYVSLEMAEDLVAQRFDSVMTRIPQSRLKDSATILTLKERLALFQEKFNGKLVIKEFPTGIASVNNIRSLLSQLENYEEFRPDVVIVDYLELLRPVREIDAEYQAQQRIAEELRGVAMEYNLLVHTATQTNRKGANVEIITDAELGDSYGKIRTCDFAMSLNQKSEEYDNGQMRGYIMKSRNGRARWMLPVAIDYGTLVMKGIQ